MKKEKQSAAYAAFIRKKQQRDQLIGWLIAARQGGNLRAAARIQEILNQEFAR